MEIITLGSLCQKSVRFHENTVTAVNLIGLNAFVKNYGDSKFISQYGISKTPALVVNHKILSQGELLSTEQIKELLENELKLSSDE